MNVDPKDLEEDIAAWSALPEWGPLKKLVADVTRNLAGRHPGIVTEAIVAAVTGSYRLVPREARHREQHHSESSSNHVVPPRALPTLSIVQNAARAPIV